MNTSDTFISHLIELRDRLLHIVAGIVLTFICLFPFANDIYSVLAHPLLQQLPQGGQMIATAVTTPFFVPMKVASFDIAGAFACRHQQAGTPMCLITMFVR